MTKRMLHENITTSEKFSQIGFEAECLYNRLLTQTDDYGNVRGSIGYIKDVCFPKNKKTKIDYQMVGKWLAECCKVGLLLLYQVDGIDYLHFNRFEDFQTLRKDRIKTSSIPSYDHLRSDGCQVGNQVVAVCPHELEVEVEVEVEVEEEYSYNKINSLEKFISWDWGNDEQFTNWLVTEKEKLDTSPKSRFNSSFVKENKEKMIDDIQSKGKKYKDYKSTFRNWLRNAIKWELLK